MESHESGYEVFKTLLTKHEYYSSVNANEKGNQIIYVASYRSYQDSL